MCKRHQSLTIHESEIGKHISSKYVNCNAMCKYAAGIHFMYTILLISNHKILLADRTSTS